MSQTSSSCEEGGYALSLVGKHIEVTTPIRDYVSEKISKIEKIVPHLIEVQVLLDVQKLNQSVDIVLKFSHFKVKVGAVTENMYSAIDKAFKRLQTKLLKWKSRIQDHYARGASVIEMDIAVLERAQEDIGEMNQEIEDANYSQLKEEYAFPQVVKTKKRPLKCLTLDEAVMKMELSNDHFMVYRSEEEQTLKVIYRRRDGSYGVMSLE